MGKNPPASAGGMGSVPDPGRSHMQGAIELTRHNYRACAVRPGLAEREVTAKRSDPGRSHMQGAIKLTRHNYRACAVRPGLAEREVTAKRSVQTNGFFFLVGWISSSGNTSSPFSWWEKLKSPPLHEKKFSYSVCPLLQPPRFTPVSLS